METCSRRPDQKRRKSMVSEGGTGVLGVIARKKEFLHHDTTPQKEGASSRTPHRNRSKTYFRDNSRTNKLLDRECRPETVSE